MTCPGLEWLTVEQAADWLVIGEEALDDLMNRGLIPRPREWGHRTIVYHWETVLAISLLLKHGLGDRSYRPDEAGTHPETPPRTVRGRGARPDAGE